ncbi:hypothetical protein T459_02054 [Capsicum annuum]|uniref:Uncharacterized protein n=1 Tax=Capsicum annuum TaxID=4072 RepID=A0A2G3AIW4_CAPAN|nr:hypothetical protein T459_02054 [Capsicum annuum]
MAYRLSRYDGIIFGPLDDRWSQYLVVTMNNSLSRVVVLYHEFNKEEQLAALGAEKAILEERKKLKAGVIESTLDAGKNLSVDIDSLLIVQFFRGLNRWIEVDHGVGPKNAYKEIDLFQMKLGKKKNQGITSNSKFLFGGHTLANWEHNASHFIIT